MASKHVKIYKTAPLQKETVCQLYPDNQQEPIACKDKSHNKPVRFDGHHLSSWKVSKYKKVFSFIFWIFRNKKENKRNIYGHSRREGNYGRLNNVSEETTKYSNFDRHQK